MTEHYTILTDKGASKIAEAIRIGQQLEITHIALGDGDGKLPQPQSNATSLVKERYRAPINSAKVDEHNTAWVIFEQVLAPDIGGWWIREVGLYDKDGDLIAIGNYPEQYKPLLTEGASTTQTVTIVIQVLSSEAITLKIDPSVVLATRQYVDDYIQKVSSLLSTGNEKLQIAIAESDVAWRKNIDSIQGSLTNRSGHYTSSDDWNSIKNPGVYSVGPGQADKYGNGVPPASYWYGILYVERSGGVITQQYIQHQGMRTFQRMTYEGSPEWGEPWAELGVASAGSIIYTASQNVPAGYLVADGSVISRDKYYNLFKAIGTTYGSGDGSSTFNLPDLRGEFIRGWDKGRGIDEDRQIGSWQEPTALRTEMGPTGPNDTSTTIGLWYSNVDRRNISTEDSVIKDPRTPTGDKAKTVSESKSSVDNSLYAAGVYNNSTQWAYKSWITIRPRNVALLACIKY